MKAGEWVFGAILYALTILAGYYAGKQTADRWYAKHIVRVEPIVMKGSNMQPCLILQDELGGVTTCYPVIGGLELYTKKP